MLANTQSQQSWQKGNTMYELIIDTQDSEKTIICSSYEELDSVIHNLPEGTFWQVRSLYDLNYHREGFVL